MRKWKRAMALLMVCVMAFGMTGCKEKKETTQEETTQTTTPEATEEATTEAAPEATSNMIENGDFENGTDKWFLYMNAGESFMDVKDGELQVDIKKVGAVEHGVQIYYDGFDLKQGGVYAFSFDVKGTMEREFDWRFQLNGGDYHAYAVDTVTLSTETQHITAEFTMEEATDPAPRLCFNMGLVNSMQEAGIKPKDVEPHTFWFDNITLELIDDSNVTDTGAAAEAPKIKVNQVGYTADASKIAVFTDLEEGDNTFQVVKADSGDVVFEGTMSDVVEYADGGEKDCTGDFSELKDEGTYKVVTGAGVESCEFTIGSDIYKQSFTDVVKMLYMQRCGCELTADLAGDFAHPACHTAEATIYGTSNKLDVSGGWHDAGDYGRYVVPAAKTVADLLLAFEKNPDAFGDACGIPESGDGVNDALNEAKYELDWMLKMQDNASGGVYHKVTCLVFPETVMPQDETDELILSPISNAATADFAAVMAMASRVFAANGDSAFGDVCLAAAKKAWDYAQAHSSDPGFKNPADVVTGEYPDENYMDEYFWAGAELYKTTGDTAYIESAKNAYKEVTLYDGLGWMDIAGYGAYTALTTEELKNADSEFYAEIEKNFIAAADAAVATSKENPYMVNKKEVYEWGSNLSAANTGMLLYMANDIKENPEYVTYADYHLNYIYGVNATGYCFVTGAGSMYPQHPHHRPCQAMGTCIPGMLVGGPNSNLEDPYATAVFKETPPAKCYVDNEQSYSVNEVTIYWNSPLIYLLTAAQQ